ncbi:MAG: hypothetical protein LBL28_06305 [Treponema sp.]|jgi:hypothetical protein|nr:hypothetical protein [Treponema sp.]
MKKQVSRYAGFFLIYGALASVLLSCAAIDPAEKYPDMVADMDPVSAGTVEVEFDRVFSSNVEKKEIEALFYPRYNTVALEFRHQTIRYRQFWDLGGRQKFVQALERYKADYAAKNLDNKFSKSRAAYGRFKGKTEWETFSFTIPGRAYPTMELGYRFRGKDNSSPYFSVLQQSAKDEYSFNSDNAKPDSLQIVMYYTRGQADGLAKIFDQDFLLSLTGPVKTPESEAPVQDEYYEYDEE